jgi:hypothetical protein
MIYSVKKRIRINEYVSMGKTLHGRSAELAKGTEEILRCKREIKISCGIGRLASTLTEAWEYPLHIFPHARLNEAEVDLICKHPLNFI